MLCVAVINQIQTQNNDLHLGLKPHQTFSNSYLIKGFVLGLRRRLLKPRAHGCVVMGVEMMFCREFSHSKIDLSHIFEASGGKKNYSPAVQFFFGYAANFMLCALCFVLGSMKLNRGCVLEKTTAVNHSVQRTANDTSAVFAGLRIKRTFDPPPPPPREPGCV